MWITHFAIVFPNIGFLFLLADITVVWTFGPLDCPSFALLNFFYQCCSGIRYHDIFIQIRNQHWITDTDPALFFSAFQGANKKNKFPQVFCFYVIEVGKFTSV
jgi:hypothetical protein